MSNEVEESKNNPGGLMERILGPPYNYSKQIKNTRQLGMSDRGDLKTLEKDVRGIVGYVKVLIEGGGPASKVKGPLGNKFFMKTAMLCKNNGKDVPRSIYINNVPNPPLPGLIKGTMTGLSSVNPFRLMGAFADATTPQCKQITLEVIDSNNRKSRETHYMTLNDIEYLNKTIFDGGSSGGGDSRQQVARRLRGRGPKLMGFNTIDSSKNENFIKDDDIIDLPDDMIIQAYYVCLAALGIYIIYRLMEKSSKT